MKLILTRHGQTEENKAGIMQGHLPGTLSELGREQARRVAERLKDVHIDKIYSSDLRRAAETAKEIAKHHDCAIEFTEELRERDIGEYSGKKKTEVGLDLSKSISELNAKDSEAIDRLVKRAKRFLQKIMEAHKDETILVVGHNVINRGLIGNITNKTIDEAGRMGNTAITIFEIEEKNHKIIIDNCSAHLNP